MEDPSHPAGEPASPGESASDPNSTPANPNDPTEPGEPTSPHIPLITLDSTETPDNDDDFNCLDDDGIPTGLMESTQTTTENEKLPQTGTTQWPVPTLFISGLLMIIFGGFLIHKKKSEA